MNIHDLYFYWLKRNVAITQTLFFFKYYQYVKFYIEICCDFKTRLIFVQDDRERV